MKHPGYGWLPVRFLPDRQPALFEETAVRWLEFGSTPLDDPFLDQTVTKLRGQSPAAREFVTNQDCLLRLGAMHAPVRPAGFIFHISRCGSTLVSNSLRAAPGTQVISESGPAGALLRVCAPVNPYLDARWQRRRHALLQALFSLYAHYPDGVAKPLIIKFSSIDTMSLPQMRQWWPDVPCLFIVRDPVEVMVSTISTSKGWRGLKDSPGLANEVFGWDRCSADAMTNEEYCARVLGRFMETAAQCITSPMEIVDYEDLNQRRLVRLAEFFGLKIPQAEPTIKQLAALYSKDPRGTQQFEDDRARKQASATAEIRQAARTWAMPFYNHIRALPTHS